MAERRQPLKLDVVRETVTCGICLQLFTDPRGLRCGHIYCLVCLQGFQTSSTFKECPVCRAETIPARNHLERLPKNKLASDMVKLVHTYEPESALEAPPEWNVSKQNGKSSAINSQISNLSGAFAELLPLLSSIGESKDEDGNPQHRAVSCDNCGKSNFIGARFKCGFCEDFDLCEDCESLPRDQVHDLEHIFVKLKKPQSLLAVGKDKVLHEDSVAMGMSQERRNTTHSVTYDGGETITANCDKCGTAPITGTRYKCGVCADYNLCQECEKTSQDFHNWKHVFLVLRHPVGFHTETPQLTHDFYAGI